MPPAAPDIGHPTDPWSCRPRAALSGKPPPRLAVPPQGPCARATAVRPFTAGTLFLVPQHLGPQPLHDVEGRGVDVTRRYPRDAPRRHPLLVSHEDPTPHRVERVPQGPIGRHERRHIEATLARVRGVALPERPVAISTPRGVHLVAGARAGQIIGPRDAVEERRRLEAVGRGDLVASVGTLEPGVSARRTSQQHAHDEPRRAERPHDDPPSGISGGSLRRSDAPGASSRARSSAASAATTSPRAPSTR